MSNVVPSYHSLMIPVFQALQQLGGVGTADEIKNLVIKNEELPDHIVNEPSTSKTAKTKLEYNIGWARVYLKKYGIAIESKRGTSTLHRDYINSDVDTIKEIIKSRK